MRPLFLLITACLFGVILLLAVVAVLALWARTARNTPIPPTSGDTR